MKKDKEIPTSEDWLLAQAEGTEEKLMLAHNTVLVYMGLGWFKRLFKTKKLFKKYFEEMAVIDKKHRDITDSIRLEIEEEVQRLVKEHKPTR